MVRTSVVLLCFALLGVTEAAWAQERIQKLSLDEAVVLALRESPTLRAKEFERQATRANEITAGLRPNPTLGYTAEKFAEPMTTQELTVTIGQTIETGGKRQRRIESAQAATRVTGHELEDLRRQVAFQVKKAFTDALVARETLALAEENLRALDQVERLQRLRAEKGDISELELLRIQIQRFAFERDAADVRQALLAAKIALRAVAGPNIIAEDFEIVGDLVFRDFSYTPADLYRIALANRPDLRAAEAARAKAQADINLARANAWWDITPQLEYKRNDTGNHTFGFGFSIPIRIFDRNQGEIARTQVEAERIAAIRQAVAIQALAEVDTALAALVTQRTKVAVLLETYLPKAQQARETVEFAYRRGGVTLLDLLDAQRTYRETASEYLRSLGNYRTALYQIEAAVGGSLER